MIVTGCSIKIFASINSTSVYHVHYLVMTNEWMCPMTSSFPLMYINQVTGDHGHPQMQRLSLGISWVFLEK